jgi:hypothetical protein
MSPIAEPHKAVEQINDVDLYNANRELDVAEFLTALGNENTHTYSNHPEIGQGYDTGSYQAGKHLDVGTFPPGCSSNCESSNTKFSGGQIDDTALYNASNELDSEEFLSDLWGANISLPLFNGLQCQGSATPSAPDTNGTDNIEAGAMF